MKLYYAPETISIAVAITLNEAGIPFEPIRVDFPNGQQRTSQFLALNPKGRVPVLDTGTDILTETGAILDYIGAIAPQANLIPSDPVRAAKMRAVMYYLASTVHVNHAHKVRGARWATAQSSLDDMIAKVAENMTENARQIDNNCLAGPYVLGDRISLADAYLYVVSTWLKGDNVDTGAFAKLTTFMDTMAARPSVRAVVAQGML